MSERRDYTAVRRIMSIAVGLITMLLCAVIWGLILTALNDELVSSIVSRSTIG